MTVQTDENQALNVFRRYDSAEDENQTLNILHRYEMQTDENQALNEECFKLGSRLSALSYR